jgi:hypothetical protein
VVGLCVFVIVYLENKFLSEMKPKTQEIDDLVSILVKSKESTAVGNQWGLRIRFQLKEYIA